MIVTKRESMASLIHDTSPILRHSCNKVIIRACVMDSEMPYFLVLSLSRNYAYGITHTEKYGWLARYNIHSPAG